MTPMPLFREGLFGVFHISNLMNISASILAAALVASATPAMAKLSSDVDHLTGETKHFSIIMSDTTVSNSIGQQKNAAIALRCVNGEFEGYIFTPTYNGLGLNSAPVSTRWGSGPITTARWSTSTSNDAFFHGNPRSFLKELTTNDTFVFAWTPYGRSRVSAKWNLGQHRAEFKEIARLCSVN